MTFDEVFVVGTDHARGWRQEIVERLMTAGLTSGRRDAVELAIHEAVCNALEHGHRGDGSVGIELQLSQPQADRLVVVVVDRALGGRWEPPNAAELGGRSAATSRVVAGERGYGLGLIRAGCDALQIASEPGTTRVAMTFAAVRHPTPGVGANGHER